MSSQELSDIVVNCEKQSVKAYVRQYLIIIGKCLLICSFILLTVDFVLPALSAIVSLLVGLYLFVVVYHHLLFRPAIIQDILFWIMYALFAGFTFFVLQGICTVIPAISATCQPRLQEWVLFSRGFSAVVTIIFWMTVRLIRIVKDCRDRSNDA